MNGIWPPPPTNQPAPPPPPPPRPEGGLDALIMSCLGFGFLLIICLAAALEAAQAWVVVLGATGVVGFLVTWISGVVYSLMSWRTRRAHLALAISVGGPCLVLVSAVLMTILGH